ncbi:putative rRNA-processing protein EBP2 [Microcaecilia unicolor]|uniref:Probable rRNA-processing protein EBP2 n=1 Tax=Microcaecilia unicolor TaxID=1415580 RepID=A0A6P7YIQ3_9AMPH|nr:probable rRNA-processing protein EBP2 [Microcaecilia unicolor]XP_030062794.1 probable rRNA-processing protein EBP2 [Microcaecilia unicolor]
MADYEEEQQSDTESEPDFSEVTDKELQDAFSKGVLKPGLNVILEGKKAAVNSVESLKLCLAELKSDLAWVERLDVTMGLTPVLAPALEGQRQTQTPMANKSKVDAEDDFQREISFYRQAQAAVLQALPQLHRFQIPTKRPEDYFAEMAKTDQHMQKIRQKLQIKQVAMEKSEKAKQLRALKKYGKKVQTEVLQKRQKEKSSMMSAVKKYQKGLSDRLDFLEEDNSTHLGKKQGAAGPHVKRGPSAKRRYKDQKFGFGGKKKGSKRNTKESYNDVSGFRASVAHNKSSGRPTKKGASKIRHTKKRPGKTARQKLKSRAR